MQFYAFHVTKEENTGPEAEPEKDLPFGKCVRPSHADELERKTAAFNEKNRAHGVISAMETEDSLDGVFGCLDVDSCEKQIASYLTEIGMDGAEYTYSEVALRRFYRDASRTCRFLDNPEMEAFFERFGIQELARSRHCMAMREDLIEPESKKKTLLRAAMLFNPAMIAEELDRIYASCTDKWIPGHPVHYLLETDDEETAREAITILINALYQNNRIQNRRWSRLDLGMIDPMDEDDARLELIYRCNEGGVVVLDYSKELREENDHASPDRGLIRDLCGVLRHHARDVLTVIRLPRECTAVKEVFYEYLGNLTLVEMTDDLVDNTRAVDTLKNMARESAVRPDKKLLEKIDPEKGYHREELAAIFDDWYAGKLKTGRYPQYASLHAVGESIAKAAPKGHAIDELEAMIGLESAKKVIHRALDYYKAQKLFAERGMKKESLSMHMVFTGTPGTAKTSVARLFAQIMKENGLLSRGTFVECGRSDLVGAYVGWTAKAVKAKFKKASGGVLFIDEAYSLVDDRKGSFGDEAINTIVQEMENHRQDVVVIFAGYSDEMEAFLERNPGLNSRIAFHVPFDDYTADELSDIADLIVSKKDMQLSSDAREKLHGIFEAARRSPAFGNGRFVRNTVEHALMAHSSRLVQMDIESITDKDIRTITGEDIEMPENKKQAPGSVIGFSA